MLPTQPGSGNMDGKIMKVIFIFLCLICFCFGQTPQASWEYNKSVSTIDTSGSYLLVNSWISTNGTFTAAQADTTKMPQKDTDNLGIDFDGTNDGFTVTPETALHPGNNDFSIAVYCKPPTDITTAPQFWNLGFGAAGYIQFEWLNGEDLRFRIYDGTNSAALQSTTDFADGQDHHIVFVFDESIGAYMYVDNVEHIKEETSEWTDLGSLSGADRGIDFMRTTKPFDGLVYYLRIYDVALTSVQVSTLYALGKYPVTISEYNVYNGYTEKYGEY